MSGQEPSRPDKGKTVKKARKAKYVVKVPSEIPFSNARARPDVGSSRPPPPSTASTPSVGPTPSTIGPTPSTIGPTPSVVGPTPPTVVPTPSVPSADAVDSADTADLDDPAPHDRPFLSRAEKVASQAITRTIKQQFLQPWASWGVISDDDKKLFWERFKWAAEHETQFHKNFNMKASHRLSEMFRDARITGLRPHWVGEHIWNSLLAHWNTPQYRIKCATAQKNRASEKGGALHTGGPSPHMNMRFAAALGRAVHVDEVFTQTHIRKGTGEYVDERSRKTIEDFSARLTQARPEGGSDADGRVDADEEMIRTQCWVDTVGGKKKGRLYGVGQLASHYSAGRGGIFRHQPSTSTTFDPNNVVSKDAYDSLLARFENLENLQPPFQTTVVQDEDSDDSDDRDNPNPDGYHSLSWPSVLPTAFWPSALGNTEGHKAVGKVSDKQITDGFGAVEKPSVPTEVIDVDILPRFRGNRYINGREEDAKRKRREKIQTERMLWFGEKDN
ncbi:hypothetical protein V8G54_035473 [Vigna mungo]|uniref:Transposase, Ptta/En/Spm, plant n=1 Tax=Vigna mungo TaxID=3915 RepID=A0AAQ3MFC0_VIGMU